MSRVFFSNELDHAAVFWRVLRRDGVALGFTTHDRDLWFDGLLHRAAPGMVPSAIRRSAGLAPDEAEVEGVLAHDSISEPELDAGLYDEASIAIGLVDWENTVAAVLYRGAIGSVSRDAGSFSAAIRSAKHALQEDTIPRTSPVCRARFCDIGCGLSPIRSTHRAKITAVDFDANSVTLDRDATGFAQGELRWLDGPQSGLVAGIVSASGNSAHLDRPLDPAVSPGATVMLREGCDHTIATCADRFGNAVNFQGEPYLPGNDFLAQYPSPR